MDHMKSTPMNKIQRILRDQALKAMKEAVVQVIAEIAVRTMVGKLDMAKCD